MENYFLLEVGVEELPSRFVESTLTQIKENLEKSLKENRVEFENIEKYGTPRRLTFVINQISDKQSDLEEELKGPSKKISVDADGNFTKPALGFMKSKGLDEADVYFKQVGKDEYLFGTLNSSCCNKRCYIPKSYALGWKKHEVRKTNKMDGCFIK